MVMYQRVYSASKLSVLLGIILGVAGPLGSVSAQDSADVASSNSGPFIVLIGAPAAGKSTNGTSIAQNYGIPLVNMGEVVTQEVARLSNKPLVGSSGSTRARARARRSASMRAALKKLEAGEFVSDEAMDAIVAARIMQDDARNGFVLDGYPGSVTQAEFLDGLLDANDMGPAIVLFLDVPDEISLERMEKRAREDDKSGFGEERLQQFRANIEPILEFYGETVFTVDATRSLRVVESEIQTIIKNQID